jgi:gamma-glutamyltranspeptidase/glutathione hydrolase
VIDGHPWSPVPLARGSHGAVVAPHHLATAAGLHVLRAGGTAVDAAIATNAVLAVVMPNGGGIGGDAFWLIWDAAASRQHALNGSGRSAAGIDAAALRERGLTSMPRRGPLTITVPGAVRSWGDAHARFGRLSRDAVLAPAIELARDGFPAWPEFMEAVETTSQMVAEQPGSGNGFAAVYRPRSQRWLPGERVRLPALGDTLATLAREGFDAFYDGDLGERQARALAAAGSPIALEDLREHRSTWGEPIGIDYRGVRVTTHPPNSSGVVALELLGVLERFEPPDATAFGPNGVADARWIHLHLEAAKLAMADRDAHLTDPEARDVPVDRLLDPERLATLAGRIDPSRASRPPVATKPPGGGTVFMATVDGAGNAVSLIESNYLGFGSGVVDPGTGIHYQNRGSYFSLDPEHANVLEPRKRTLHTLLPGMLFRNGRVGPWIVVGSMGGDAQPQVQAQFVSAVVDGGLDIRTAIAAPRFYIEPPDHFAPPTAVSLEPRHAAGIDDALRALGHELVPTAAFDSNLGHEHAIELVGGGPAEPGGSLAAATDPRSEGLPAVW